jgi:hypothetical protein
LIREHVKRCFKCGKRQALGEFYRHPQMADGLLGKCKTCTRRDVREHRAANVERARAYDCERARTPKRRALRQRVNMKARGAHPEKYLAHKAVFRAVAAGKLVRLPCEVCGRADSHAHHPDYARRLVVRWLCPVHHAEAHREDA